MSTTRYAALTNAAFVDLSSYRTNRTELPAPSAPVTSAVLRVALVLKRAQDPTPLLNANWATRQQRLAELTAQGTLWQTYGADPVAYAQVLSTVRALGIPTVDEADPSNGYVSSVESRTIWVQLTIGQGRNDFRTLFDTDLLQATSGNALFWRGDLSLPEPLVQNGVLGLWFDTGAFDRPITTNTVPGGVVAILPLGPQSLGNSAPQDPIKANPTPPNELALAYGFPLSAPRFWDPLSPEAVTTGTIGLIEPGNGDATTPALDASGGFQRGLDRYRRELGILTPGAYVNVAPGGQKATDTSGERSLDVGVVTAVNPQSLIALYAGANAETNTYTAYQAAFWDNVNKPAVVSSSVSSYSNIAPGSPFAFALNQLFIDAALRNISVFNAAGDGGSGAKLANGLTNVEGMHSNPFSVSVGGTSLSSWETAATDLTLSSLLRAARGLDPATLWLLIAGGLKSLRAVDPAASFIETVWNSYDLDANNRLNKGYQVNATGAGGANPRPVNPGEPAVPGYQRAYGLSPTTADPEGLAGRGVPDVAALAGGNSRYKVPTTDMQSTDGSGGTSAASPLWAALTSQINAVFDDQGLPQLGYMNDLLYTASAIAPASFNDVSLGSNASSYTQGGPIKSDGGSSAPDISITPTGYGYSAAPGYDLASGLGTPNGRLLARALTGIAHQQMFFPSGTALLDAGTGLWRSPADQSLLLQAGSDSPYAWTSRLAQQSLQHDFDPALVKLFDGQSQGALQDVRAGAGEAVPLSVPPVPANTPQAGLTNAFGFVDFLTGSGGASGAETLTRVARPVAVAMTAGGLDGQQAVVRMRRNSSYDHAVLFYRVDDLTGVIDGVAPGQAGYAELSLARAYDTTEGKDWVQGPADGAYSQTRLRDVDAGDLVAMRLSSNGENYWGFAQANERVEGVAVGHLWNYGLNTWGWEDLFGGGDRDFNDLIVQLDFTSAAGSGWLA